MNLRANFLLFLWLAAGIGLGVIGYTITMRITEPYGFGASPVPVIVEPGTAWLTNR